MHCLFAWWQWALQHLQSSASPRGGGEQWNIYSALPHRRGALHSATLAIHCLAAGGQRAVRILQYTASLPGDNG